ncbi:MAG: hypothetical protein Q9187_001259, partial [Circinaria calcarea]
MLRLPATQINLSQRDLTWHTNRHQARLAQYVNVPHPGSSLAGLHAHGEEVAAVKPGFRHGSLDIDRVVNAHGSVISDEPILRDSRAFWDGLLADVLSRSEVPIDTKQLAEGRQCPGTETSLNAETSVRSSGTSCVRRASTGSFNSSGQETPEYEAQFDEKTNHPVSKEQSEEEVYLRSRFSSDTLSSPEQDHGEELFDFQLPHEESTLNATARRRHSFFAFHRRNNTCNSIAEEEASEFKLRSPQQTDLDGSSDTFPDHHRNKARSGYTDINTDRTIDRNQTRHTRRFGMATLEADEQDQDEAVYDLSSLFTELDDQSVSPLPPYLPRSIELLRSRSGDLLRSTLPRSPLYISQVPKSSSPEKHPASVTGRSTADVAGEPDLLSCPPRRRKRYIHSSENQSIVGSESSQRLIKALGEGADLTQLDDLYQQIRSSSAVSTPSHEDDTYTSPFLLSSQPRLTSDHPRTLRKSSSAHERHSSLSHPVLPRLSSPSLSKPAIPSLPLLPPPFSKTPRRLSPSHNFPSSPPINPFTTTPYHQAPQASSVYVSVGPSSSPDPLSLPPYASLPALPPRNPFSPTVDQHRIDINQRHSSSVLSNPSTTTPPGSQRLRQRYVPSPSPPPPMTPHRSIRVYNDSLPASVQPQTPIGLSRNGLPHMLTMTAPAGPLARAPLGSAAWRLDGGDDQTPRFLGSPRRA